MPNVHHDGDVETLGARLVQREQRVFPGEDLDSYGVVAHEPKKERPGEEEDVVETPKKKDAKEDERNTGQQTHGAVVFSDQQCRE